MSFPSWCEYWKQKITSKIFKSFRGAPPLKCGIIYKELTEFVLTRYSTNILIHSLTYAMHVDINPPACCCGVVYVVWWWWECWDDRDVWKDVGIGGNFSKGCQLCNTLDPVFVSVWWEWWSNLGVQCYWLGYDAYKPDPSLPPLSLHVRGPSTFLVLSTPPHISSTSFANYPLTACWYE